jgi:Fic family protein
VSGSDRESKLKPRTEFKELSLEERADLEARNALLQFDVLREMIDSGLGAQAAFVLRPSAIGRLNKCAVQGLVPSPGALRTDEIDIVGSSHHPPTWEEVPSFLEEMCEYVNGNWRRRSPLHLSAYVMWRLNWIHPYPDGNGRTSRAASYLVLCVATGYLLPGEITIPHQIAADKRAYYNALEKADAAFSGHSTIDVSTMEELLKKYLARQLLQVVDKASGEDVEVPVPPGPAWNMD